MRAFRNLKIGVKLFLGFGLVIAIAGFIIVLSMRNMRHVNEDMFLMLDNSIERYNILNIMHADIVDSRRIVANMAFRLGDQAALGTLRTEALTGHANLIRGIEEYEENMRNDQLIDPQRQEELLNGSAQLRTLINRYRNDIIDGMFRTASTGIVGDAQSRDNVDGVFAAGALLYDQISNQFEFLRNGALTTRDNRTNELIERAAFVRTMATVTSIITIFIALLIAYGITRAISKPLKQAMNTLKDVSQGKLEVNINRDDISKDETGDLTRDVVVLIDVIKRIVQDLSDAHHEYMEVGDMKYTIDLHGYQNSFAEVIKRVNSIFTQNTKDLLSMSDILSKVAEGDFSQTVNVNNWPGDWATMPKSIVGLTGNLKSINDEINVMINNIAVKGDLDSLITAENYNGDWSKLMQGLNNISKAVKAPIMAINIAMEEMQNGNFDLNIIDGKITAAGYSADANKYGGIFKTIIQNTDTSFANVDGYINEIEKILAQIAVGDLRQSISREYLGSFDLIKRSVNSISTTLSKTMGEISAASEQVLSGAKQISISATDLANGAQQQASSIEELNASIDVINQQTQQNAQSAAEASNLSRKSTENANTGNETMKHMLSAMEEIKTSSNEISKIIKNIEDITFQTNLLSLNASVEAARAGEHGRGFAVVADEVRNLASKSQQSTIETTSLINDSINRVDAGSNIAAQTSESLAVIVKNAGEILEIINNISASSKEQAESISQVSIGLAQISNVVQSNSAVSEQAAAASQELNSQAEVLRQLVSFFKV
ncbi:MAG: methyl-accepting chemotaxis protein [Defluviitaleaceae bacterium]|nr:methyl-accepting chemotaxis protein [Defluviitaleaceae bacterium]MCL2275957.1 methyl-accepting chemotaxis protein [Defluviitaleaceae bacterium]